MKEFFKIFLYAGALFLIFVIAAVSMGYLSATMFFDAFVAMLEDLT